MTRQSNNDEGQPGPAEMPRPRQHLEAFRRQNPGAFKGVDHMRALRQKGDSSCPQWCFLSLEEAYYLLYGNCPPQDPQQLREALEMTALAPWRVTQGIYRPDPELLENLEEMGLDEEIPTAELMGLPQWCVYVETPGSYLFGMPTEGFFAHLLPDGDRPQLRLLFDADDSPESRRLMGDPTEEGLAPGQPRLYPGAIDLSAQDLRASLSHFAASAVEISTQYWEEPVSEGTREAAQGIEVDNLASQYTGPVAILRHLCSPEAEYRDTEGRDSCPANPEPKKTRKGPRLFPPQEPVVWKVR